MKESAGEANMTVITIVLIGLVAAAGAIIIPNLLNGMSKRGCCSAIGGTWNATSSKCQRVTQSGTTDISDETYWDDTNKKCK